MNELETCYSINMEDYHDDIQQVIEDVIGDIEVFPATFTFGEADSKKHTIGDFLNMEYIFEDAQERAGEECGEWVDGWLENIKEEHKITLAKLIDVWATGTDNQPKFYSVENVRHITVEILNSDGDYKIKTNDDKGN